jgi:hypothetical protein
MYSQSFSQHLDKLLRPLVRDTGTRTREASLLRVRLNPSDQHLFKPIDNTVYFRLLSDGPRGMIR